MITFTSHSDVSTVNARCSGLLFLKHFVVKQLFEMASKVVPNLKEFSFHKCEGAWEYFLRERMGQCAQCKICKSTIKTVGGSTKGLHVHLETKHKINVRKRPSEKGDETENEMPAKSANTLDKYGFLAPDDLSLPATLARMAACDGIPFQTFAKSNDLRRGLHALGFTDIPQSPNGIHGIIMAHGDSIRKQTIAELASMKKNGTRFSVTFDEWTSLQNRRYMNVNVHAGGEKFWNLGLIRVKGSMPATQCIKLLKEKLSMFGLNLDNDIVCIVTDGASVMTKTGKLINAQHQLCLAHGIQLAVLDILYKKCIRQTDDDNNDDLVEIVEIGNENEVNNETDENVDLEMVCESEDIDESLYAEGFGVDTLVVPANDFDLVQELPAEYQRTVECVRKVVKLFKRSPTKNDDTLQPYVVSDCGREVQLKLDCKTRWNSLLEMLSTFLRLRGPIQKALIDLKQSSLVSDTDWDVIRDIVSSLEPVKVVVEALCRRETSLLSADAALKLCLDELRSNGSDLAKATAAALRTRIKQRRSLAAVMQYLHNPYASTDSDGVFTVASAATVRKAVFDLLQRLEYSSDVTQIG